jgi:3alpha(or 20beta)-hydroxysteroid dehydrogenase
MTTRLAGRVAVISGGARGQGAAHARRLATEGAHVVCGDVLHDKGFAEAARLRAEGLDVTFVPLDVTSPADWSGVVAIAVERFAVSTCWSTTPESST